MKELLTYILEQLCSKPEEIKVDVIWEPSPTLKMTFDLTPCGIKSKSNFIFVKVFSVRNFLRFL